MEETKQDVNSEESSTSQEAVVNQTETDQQSQEQQEQGTQETSDSQEVKEESSTDERGVPLNNVYAEFSRKFAEQNELIKNLSSQINQNQQTTQQNQTSDEQLLWCIEDPNSAPEAKFYARNELRRRDESRQEKKMREIFSNYQQQQTVQQQRSQSFGWFASNFPEAVMRDNAGNAIGFNETHPLVQRIGEYMKDPAAAQRGDALMIAAKNAAFDLGYVANKKLANKVNQTTAQLKREQKKTLIGGSGVNPQEQTKSKIAKVAEQYKNTRDPKAFKELIKSRGLMPT